MYQKTMEMNVIKMNVIKMNIVYADYIISCVYCESQKHGFPITTKSEVFA